MASSSQEMVAIKEGAERERRVAKVGGWGIAEGSIFCRVSVSLGIWSASWGHDNGSWDTLDDISRAGLAWFCDETEGESSGFLDETSSGLSSAASWGLQYWRSLGKFGRSLETFGRPLDGIWVLHELEGELSLLGTSWRSRSFNPIPWQRASTCLTSLSCWILNLAFSSCSLAKASASGATWAAASNKRASTRLPKACRSQWISPTAHRSANSNFFFQNCSSSSSSWTSRSPMTSSRPDSAQGVSGLFKASWATEAGRKSRLTPGMVRPVEHNVWHSKVLIIWIHNIVEREKNKKTEVWLLDDTNQTPVAPCHCLFEEPLLNTVWSLYSQQISPLHRPTPKQPIGMQGSHFPVAVAPPPYS